MTKKKLPQQTKNTTKEHEINRALAGIYSLTKQVALQHSKEKRIEESTLRPWNKRSKNEEKALKILNQSNKLKRVSIMEQELTVSSAGKQNYIQLLAKELEQKIDKIEKLQKEVKEIHQELSDSESESPETHSENGIFPPQH